MYCKKYKKKPRRLRYALWKLATMQALILCVFVAEMPPHLPKTSKGLMIIKLINVLITAGPGARDGRRKNTRLFCLPALAPSISPLKTFSLINNRSCAREFSRNINESAKGAFNKTNFYYTSRSPPADNTIYSESSEFISFFFFFNI